MTKRAPTAYNFLTKDKDLRTKMKSDHPDWTQNDIMEEYGRLWKEMSNEDKQKYVDQAEQAKESFVPSPSSTNEKEYVTKTTLVRAKTAFMHYLYDPNIRGPIKEENKEYKPSDLTQHISKMWGGLNDDEKKPWEEKSEKQKQELLDNPQYKTKKVKKPKEKEETRTQELEKMVASLQKQIEELKTLYEQKNSA